MLLKVLPPVAAIGTHIQSAGIATDVKEDGTTGAAGACAFVVGDGRHRLTVGNDVVAIAGDIAGNDVYQSSAVAAGRAVLSIVAESAATAATEEGTAIGLGQGQAANPLVVVGITAAPHKSAHAACAAISSATGTRVATVGSPSAIGLLAAGVDLVGQEVGNAFAFAAALSGLRLHKRRRHS